MTIVKSAYELASERTVLPKGRVAETPVVSVSEMRKSQEKVKNKQQKEAEESLHIQQVEPEENPQTDTPPEEVETPPQMLDGSGLDVIYSGPVLTHSGFSKMNREIARRLYLRGVNIRVNDLSGDHCDVESDVKNFFEELSTPAVKEGCPQIYAVTTPPIMGYHGRRIAFSMMETSNSVHRDYSERLGMCQEVWVPSEYLRDILFRSGISVPVDVVPLGVDTRVFNDRISPMPMGGDVRKFKFVSVFWWSIRKGYDLLLKAYLDEFSDDDDVSLIISTKSFSGRQDAEISDTINAFIKQSGKSNPPHIALHNSHMSELKLASLYRACDAFILMSRGEGFGLPWLEAGACGIPVIATNCTAQSSYLDNSVAYMIEPDGYEISKANIGSLAKWCRYYEDQPFPVFKGRAMSSLKKTMRSLYDGDDTAKGKSKALLHKINSSLTWDHTVDTVISLLRQENK